jgi:feruloyl esterase
VAPGAFTAPAGRGGRAGGANPYATLSAFCRVAATLKPTPQSTIGMEVWLPLDSARGGPASGWNGKLQVVGNGGFAGTISYGAMATALNRNYATASTDTGHQVTNPDGIWALGHDNLIVDFAYRGTHEMTLKGQAITAAYYGRNANLSYFVGCSKGGQQALMEAQRYPDDYDGIIAGDPANFWTHHYLGGHLWPALSILRDTTLAHYISPQKLPAIRDASNKQCDALDGVVDGVLNDPRQCHFDTSVLLCQGAETNSCLTQPQLEALNAIYAGPPHDIYPGLMPGDETGWQAWTTGSDAQHPGAHLGLGIPFFKYFIFDDPNWDFHTLDFDRDVATADAKMGPIIDSTDPDLHDFRALGGKLIMYHGWADPAISAYGTIEYNDKVIKAVGGKDRADQFVRLFLAPGMHHCSGGPGPNSFDMLPVLEEWVERGVAPTRVIASHSVSGRVDRTRPLCPHPQVARYGGSGSIDDAANFRCEAPSR